MRKQNISTPSFEILGSGNEHFLDKFCALLLALAPILRHYVGIYESAGITALLLVVPIITLRFFKKFSEGVIDKNCISAVLPMVLFEGYSILIHGFSVSKLLYHGFMIWVYFCVACGCVNLRYVIRYAAMVACIATGALVLQYTTYYLFGFHTRCVPTELFLVKDNRWLERALYGLSEGATSYRPSSIFMEPSHLFLYFFPLLCMCLLLPDMTVWRKRIAVILTVGIVLSTSGMGIAVAIGLWGLYLAMYYEKRGKIRFRWTTLFSWQTVCIIVLLLIALVGAYCFVPFFRNSVNRIFVNSSGSTAIEGRISRVSEFVKTITGKAVLFGASGVASTLDFHLPGFFATYIKWGIIGLVLTYWFYGQGLLRLKGAYFWFSFLILVLSFFTAHTHGTFYMIYYFLFLINGYYEKKHGTLT